MYGRQATVASSGGALCTLPREEDEISKSEEPREWVPHVSHKLQKAQQQSVAGRF